jgi:hypothetical protein
LEIETETEIEIEAETEVVIEAIETEADHHQKIRAVINAVIHRKQV